MTTTPKTGWAVFINDAPLLATVAGTRIGAIVNFLMTERNLLVLQAATHEQIESAWMEKKDGAEIHEVTVTLKVSLQ